MRLRFAMLGAVASALALAAAPGLAGAAPLHNRGLTIKAVPNPIDAGEAVLVYGQLKGTDVSGKTIVLYHHIAGSHRGYSVIGSATTDSHGFYEFTRQLGVVETNRSWFARLAGDSSVHSRTVFERVRALVSLAAASQTGYTRHPVTFTGHVVPNHPFGRVLLQQQVAGDDWRTIKTGRIGPGANFSIQYSWRMAGDRVLRAVLPSDRRNLRGESDPVSVTIQQTQNQRFTINTATPRISWGSSATIAGTLFTAGGSGESNTAVTLCHRFASTSAWICDQAGTTGAGGGYSFTVNPTRNAWYYVKTVLPPRRRTASLFIGVKDIITLAGSTTGTVGQPDTFSGTVTPNKAGAFVLLQRRGADGDFHTVAVQRVQGDGTYSFTHVFSTAGTKVFRTRILGDATNLGDVSPPLQVTVAAAPVSTLTPAS
jgi:hypothetical protein